jgi:hypothetical protein
MKKKIALALATALCLVATGAWAQAWPAKPIRLAAP